MPNYSQISKHCPFKFVPATATPGIHFDDDLTSFQLKDFQKSVFYTQKWLRGTVTRLQCMSTVAPDDLKIYNSLQQIVHSIPWTAMFPLGAGQLNVYELDFDISGKPEDYYWLYQNFGLLSYQAPYISECIYSKDTHKYVKPITYSHSVNDFDTIWLSGPTRLKMTFCVEYELLDPDFKADRINSINQTRDTVLVNGVPYRIFYMQVAPAKGASPYIFDIINRIFCCDYVNLKGKQFAMKDGSDIDTQKIKNYPLRWATLELVESINSYSVQQNDLTELAPGIITGYNIDTGFFGPGNIVPIQEIESI